MKNHGALIHPPSWKKVNSRLAIYFHGNTLSMLTMTSYLNITLILSQPKKIILNVDPEFLTLILKYTIILKGRLLAALVSGLGIFDTPLYLNQLNSEPGDHLARRCSPVKLVALHAHGYDDDAITTPCPNTKLNPNPKLKNNLTPIITI